jgi:heat shock protein HslJ
MLCLIVSAAGCSTAGLPAGPSAPSGTGAASITDLASASWQLQSMESSGTGSVAVPVGAFTITLSPDGSLAVRADCNRCSGSYSTTERTLGVGLLACTRAYCAATAPLDSQFLSLLQGDNVATVAGASLALQSSRGTLRFVR